MAWLFGNNSKTFSTSPAQSSVARRFKEQYDAWTAEALRQAENSSRQRPGLSYAHNLSLSQSSSPNLLNLPTKVRKNILRFALIAPESIIVAADHPEESAEPPLLTVCRAIRDEARAIFYKENSFELQVQEFNILTVLPWLKLTSTFYEEVEDEKMRIERAMAAKTLNVRALAKTDVEDFDAEEKTDARRAAAHHFVETKWVENDSRVYEAALSYLQSSPEQSKQREMAEYIFDKHLPAVMTEEHPEYGSMIYAIPMHPHWENLMAWLKLFYEDEYGRYRLEDSRPEFAAVSGMFDVVAAGKGIGMTWDRIMVLFPGLCKMMGVGHKGWLENH